MKYSRRGSQKRRDVIKIRGLPIEGRRCSRIEDHKGLRPIEMSKGTKRPKEN